MITAELVLNVHAHLAEGPCWLPERSRLMWVDIMAGHVHLFDPVTGEDRSLDVGQPVGVAAPASDGRAILAVRDGFALLDLDTGELERIAEVEPDTPGNRMNDGKADSAGRFWAGTMALDTHAGAGALYRLDRGHFEPVVTGVTISNGLGWSLDDHLMYYNDTPTKRVDVFDFDPATGAIANRRPFYQVDGKGSPDGLAVDEEGGIWVALFGGGRVLHLRPDGSLADTIELPVSQVTCPGFGGPDLGDLYVTTARENLTPEQRAAEPLAGAIFRCRPGVRGLPPHHYVA